MRNDGMLLIDDVTAVTMDGRRRVLTDAAIAVDGDRIVAVDKRAALAERHPGAEVLAGRGMVAIPGLIDTHAHADQSLLRGTTDDMHWIPFLANVIEPYLRTRDPADAVVAYRLSMLEMLRGGTTCFLSPNVDPRDDYEALAVAVEETGIRAILARWVEPPRDAEDGSAEVRAVVDAAVAVVDRWQGAGGGLVAMWFGLMVPREPGDRSFPRFYPAVAGAARELSTRIVYHFCSEREDAEFYEATFGVRPAEWALANGVLGENVVLINGGLMNDAEIGIVADTGTHISYGPSPTMKMASGLVTIPRLRAAGVNVALGTDGGANNNSHDMIREMKAACLMQNGLQLQPATLTAEEALEMATIAAARAIGRESELGSLEAGKLADVVLVDLARPHTSPVNDVVSNLVYAAHGGNVDTVMVGGRVLMRSGRVEHLDERAILADARGAADRVFARIGQRPSRRWPIL